MYIAGPGLLLQAAVARVADHADDLALALGVELAHHAPADHQPLVQRILVLEELRWPCASLMITTGGATLSSRSVNARPRFTGILKTSK